MDLPPKEVEGDSGDEEKSEEYESSGGRLSFLRNKGKKVTTTPAKKVMASPTKKTVVSTPAKKAVFTPGKKAAAVPALFFLNIFY